MVQKLSSEMRALVDQTRHLAKINDWTPAQAQALGIEMAAKAHTVAPELQAGMMKNGAALLIVAEELAANTKSDPGSAGPTA